MMTVLTVIRINCHRFFHDHNVASVPIIKIIDKISKYRYIITYDILISVFIRELKHLIKQYRA